MTSNQPANTLTKQSSNLSFSSVDEMFNSSTNIAEKVAIAQSYKPSFRGKIEMIIGPMFAGKSTELLRRMNRHKFSGKSCLYVKYVEDTRYCEKSIATHDL
jgi:ABC-type phosphate/phosphonate transport system ATPase subunit